MGKPEIQGRALKITVAAVEFATFRPMGTCREGLVLFALCRTIGVIGLITGRNYPELIEINRLISTTFVVPRCTARR